MEQAKTFSKIYMSVGEIAKKMGVSVRTLQHYDKENILKPSAESEGGRRLYSDKDLILLHQILSLKHLGFSLSDIRDSIMPLDEPKDVMKMCLKQEENIKKQIESLTKSLEDIRCFRNEVLKMNTVDFKVYADIIVNLQLHNEYYWLIKYFDEPTLDHIRLQFDEETGRQFMNRFTDLNEKIMALYEEKVPHDSEQAQEVAKVYWQMVMEFTKGDPEILEKIQQFAYIDEIEGQLYKTQATIMPYIEKMLEVYLNQISDQTQKENM